MSNSKQLLAILTGVYFTYMLDYMIMPALTQSFVRVFQSNPQELGILVSAYSLSASIFGFIGAIFLDRFNRKTALLVLYAGFAASLLMCALSNSAQLLTISRAIAGAFSGLMVATLFSIIGDTFPPQEQGLAFGTALSSFAVASLVGVPLGLFLAEKFSWQAIFFLNAGFSAAIWAIVVAKLPKIEGHLQESNNNDSHSSKILKKILTAPSNLSAFGVTAFIAMASYSLIPFINPFLAANIGFDDSQIRSLYIVGGVSTFLISFPTGWLSDKFGKQAVFLGASFILIPSTLLFSTIPTTAYPLVMAIFVLFMTLSRARRIPALALITSSVSPKERAGFLSVNASFEQLASGVAASLAGLVISRLPNGELQGYWIVGVASSILAILAAILLQKVNAQTTQVKDKTSAVAPEIAEEKK